jgi:hypothetical protein
MQSMSIGYLVDEENPMIWRGPMVTQALEQMLRDTLWRGVDYMIIDLLMSISKGRAPKKLTSASLAIDSPPPVPKIALSKIILVKKKYKLVIKITFCLL